MNRSFLPTRPVPIAIALCAVLLPSASRAETSQGSAGPRPIYRSTSNLDPTAGNNGADDFLISWTATTGVSPSNVADPHIVLEVGQYFSLSRSSSGHPFFVMSGNMPVKINKAGKLYRPFNDQGTLDSYKLADGNGLAHGSLQDNGTTQGGNPIFWQPTVGTYYYTCGVPGHNNMVGRIDVVPSIDHEVFPRPFVTVTQGKLVKTKKTFANLSGVSSAKKVKYSYKDGSKKYSKTALVSPNGKWKAKIYVRKSRKVKVTLSGIYNRTLSRPARVTVKKTR
ncbi:MAG: hypothetical protein P1U87_15105 [Verrucomicrobiales bacterium]|nr:hypothetical protein [Verrucomicrobiales bacterium]